MSDSNVSNGVVKVTITLLLPPGLLSHSISDVSTVCFSGYEGEDYVKKRRSVRDLKSSAKNERSAAEKGAKRAKVTVQNGAEVFSETGLSGRKDVQVCETCSM